MPNPAQMATWHLQYWQTHDKAFTVKMNEDRTPTYPAVTHPPGYSGQPFRRNPSLHHEVFITQVPAKCKMPRQRGRSSLN